MITQNEILEQLEKIEVSLDNISKIKRLISEVISYANEPQALSWDAIWRGGLYYQLQPLMEKFQAQSEAGRIILEWLVKEHLFLLYKNGCLLSYSGEQIQLVIQQDPRVLLQKDESGNTLAHLAIEQGDIEMLRWLEEICPPILSQLNDKQQTIVNVFLEQQNKQDAHNFKQSRVLLWLHKEVNPAILMFQSAHDPQEQKGKTLKERLQAKALLIIPALRSITNDQYLDENYLRSLLQLANDFEIEISKDVIVDIASILLYQDCNTVNTQSINHSSLERLAEYYPATMSYVNDIITIPKLLHNLDFASDFVGLSPHKELSIPTPQVSVTTLFRIAKNLRASLLDPTTNTLDHNCTLAYHIAAREQKIAIMAFEWMLENNPSLLRQVNPSTGETIAHSAAKRGAIDVLKWICENQQQPTATSNLFSPVALIKQVNLQGQNIAHSAALRKKVKTLKWLYDDNVVDFNQKDNKGRSVFDYVRILSKRPEYTEVCSVLEEIKHRHNKKDTPAAPSHNRQ